MQILTIEEKMLISSRIKEIRQEKKLTLQQFGALMGVTKATVSRYESGDVENIPLPRVKLLSQALRVSPAWIIGLSDIKYLD